MTDSKHVSVFCGAALKAKSEENFHSYCDGEGKCECQCHATYTPDVPNLYRFYNRAGFAIWSGRTFNKLNFQTKVKTFQQLAKAYQVNVSDADARKFIDMLDNMRSQKYWSMSEVEKTMGFDNTATQVKAGLK